MAAAILKFVSEVPAIPVIACNSAKGSYGDWGVAIQSQSGKKSNGRIYSNSVSLAEGANTQVWNYAAEEVLFWISIV